MSIVWNTESELPIPSFHCKCGEVTEGFSICLKCDPQTYTVRDGAKMKILIGTVPNLPWYKVLSMTDVEIKEFNDKHLVEIEMSNMINLEYCVKCDKMVTTGERRECNKCDMYSIHGSKPLPKPDAIKALAESKDDISKLGKIDMDKFMATIDSVYAKEIWNAAIEAAAKCAEINMDDCDIHGLIRKLKK